MATENFSIPEEGLRVLKTHLVDRDGADLIQIRLNGNVYSGSEAYRKLKEGGQEAQRLLGYIGATGLVPIVF